jgi:hypothetical protein
MKVSIDQVYQRALSVALGFRGKLTHLIRRR